MSSNEKLAFHSSREWIKYHLIPVNTLVVFAGVVVATLDAAAPIARPYTKVLTTIAAAAAIVLVLASVLPIKKLHAFLKEPRWPLWLAFFGAFACAGAVSVAHGANGALASSSPTIANFQKAFFDLDSKVTAIQMTTTAIHEDTTHLRSQAQTTNTRLSDVQAATESVKTGVLATAQSAKTTERVVTEARADTAAIRARMENPEEFEAEHCPDIVCTVASGATRQKLTSLMDGGAQLPRNILGFALARLISTHNKNRVDLVDLYLSSGALRDVNEPLLDVNWGSTPVGNVAGSPAAPSEVGQPNCYLGRLRPLEMAVLSGDAELRDWLLQHGADPHLRNSWCRLGPSPSQFSAAEFTKGTSTR